MILVSIRSMCMKHCLRRALQRLEAMSLPFQDTPEALPAAARACRRQTGESGNHLCVAGWQPGMECCRPEASISTQTTLMYCVVVLWH